MKKKTKSELYIFIDMYYIAKTSVKGRSFLFALVFFRLTSKKGKQDKNWSIND